MNFIHVHLLMNHLPVIGTFVGLCLLLAAMLRKSDELSRTALVVFVLAGIIAVPTYLTGEQAEVLVQSIPAISRNVVLRHDDAAAFALGGAIVLGLLALLGLVLMRTRRAPRWLQPAALALAVVVGGLMAYTANLGGQIRHPEIGAPAPSVPVDIQTAHEK